ncbi:unnamed protein product [Phyllotreta striolata]|uniref:HMG box domain-containing protein n=1 Tax=Phyllotreta striolata TaxID=444603 RepID=A0A9N9XKH0_PHYSR|nr:unnamed protein product [Phyllotreta striolata]
MNSKKYKRNAGIDGNDDGLRKTKKKKIESTNENLDYENKPIKRKNVETEDPDEVPSKKTKKNKFSGNDNTELVLSNENIENVQSTKNEQKNGHIGNEIEAEGTNVDNGAVSKKGKKKKKSKADDQESNENVSTVKPSKRGTKSSKLTAEELEEPVVNSSKVILTHEVNIVDIKGEKVDEDDENVVTISIKEDGLDSDWDENDLLKQLERKVEKKDPPKETRAGIDWPNGDLIELMDRMETYLPENDLKPYMKRVEALEWDKIAFKNYSSEDCKKTWNLVLKKVRRYRILKEVIQDAKEWIVAPRTKSKKAKNRHPDMPRRPLSAYFIYYLKKKDSLQAEHPGLDATELAKMCSQKFKLLPPENRMKYEKIANKNKEEYEQKMKEFYDTHPECKAEKELKSKRPPKLPKSPKPVVEKPPKLPKEKVPKRPLNAFQYYHLSEASKEQVDDKGAFKELCKERWKQMPDDKKIEWISYSEAETLKYEEELKEYIKNHPDYVHTATNKPQLTKEELLVKERLSGKPPKPPVSAYNLFARLILNPEVNSDIKNIPVKERLVYVSNQWKECTEEDKKHYKELFDQAIEKYNKEYSAYLESLPEEERQLEIAKTKSKRTKSEEKDKKTKAGKPLKKKADTNSENKKAVNNKVNNALKKVEKKPKKLIEPEQPPISPLKYFASLYKGDESVAKAWKALSADERKNYEDELTQKKKAYILDFEKFLKSMTKEELESFSNSRKKQNQNVSQEDEDEDETSDQSDSDDSNDDSGNEEEEN